MTPPLLSRRFGSGTCLKAGASLSACMNLSAAAAFSSWGLPRLASLCFAPRPIGFPWSVSSSFLLAERCCLLRSIRTSLILRVRTTRASSSEKSTISLTPPLCFAAVSPQLFSLRRAAMACSCSENSTKPYPFDNPLDVTGSMRSLSSTRRAEMILTLAPAAPLLPVATFLSICFWAALLNSVRSVPSLIPLLMLRTARRMRLTVKLVLDSFSFFSCQSRSRFAMSFAGHPTASGVPSRTRPSLARYRLRRSIVCFSSLFLCSEVLRSTAKAMKRWRPCICSVVLNSSWSAPRM
mmetsp:Transcript_27649/g.63056  ORF Transcript_27649/g.63056 Transcript_27649/m.63056 type:complete len:294 (-) Transcript_27649:775-1656(-)